MKIVGSHPQLPEWAQNHFESIYHSFDAAFALDWDQELLKRHLLPVR
jgi:hypothetical protein